MAAHFFIEQQGAQIAIAWVLARGTDIVPVVGARRRDPLVEALGAVDVALAPDEAARIERAFRPRPPPASAIPPRCSNTWTVSGPRRGASPGDLPDL